MAGLTYDAVMNLWTQAGGAPQSAAMAAAVADASSGLDPAATSTASDGTTERRGLWQIPSTLAALSTLDPMGNARAAIQLSSGGTDFSKWCSTWSDNNCGQDGGTYLGEGSNALASLAQRGGKYSVIGGVGVTTALPTGQVTAGDSTATSSPAASPAASGSNRLIVIVVIALVLAIGYYLMKHKGKSPPPKEE